MRIAILGATGRTGRHLLQQGLAAGHQVTAVVRDPSRVPPSSGALTPIRADVTQPDSLASALSGQHAVLSALGVSGLLASLRPMTFHQTSAAAIITAMNQAGIARFIGLTSVGVEPNPPAALPYRRVVKPLLRHKYADMAAMEQRFQASDLDWTIIRPARLTNAKRTGKYRIGAGGMLPALTRIARSDVAAFMLDTIDSNDFTHRCVALSY